MTTAAIDRTIHVRASPPPQPGTPALARFTSRATHDGVSEEDDERWTPGGTLLARSRRLALAP